MGYSRWLLIDQSFIQNLETNKKNFAIVEAIIILANKLNMDVVAEGVETLEQVTLLQSIGCHQLQGYHFSAPVPGKEAEKLLYDYNVVNCKKAS